MKRLRTALARTVQLLTGRSALTTSAELIGCGSASYGCWMAWHPLGPIVGGLALIAVGVIQAPSPVAPGDRA